MERLRVCFCVLAVVLFPEISWAETTSEKFDNTLPEMPLISVDHRVDKNIFVAVEPLGRLPTSGYGFRLGYYITPDSLIGLNYSTGVHEADEAEYKSDLLEVTYRRFFTNSFYMGAGVASESLILRYDVIGAINSFERFQSKGEIDRSGFVLHMGNQWQWSYFTLGCDWLGHHLAVVKKEVFKPADGGDASDEARQKSEVKKMTKSTLQMLRFYLGFSF